MECGAGLMSSDAAVVCSDGSIAKYKMKADKTFERVFRTFFIDRHEEIFDI